MSSSAPRSCYVLELSVQPGGSRWAELHAYTEPRHIRAWIGSFVSNPAGLSTYHAIWYGATLGVWVVQRGVVVGFVDLEPHLRARLGDSPWVPLSGAQALVIAARPKDDEDEEDDEPADFEDCDLEAYEAMELALDWDAVAAQLPALELPLLEPGQRTPLTYAAPLKIDTYLDTCDSLRFGSHDAEAGERLEPPFTIPGWDNDGR